METIKIETANKTVAEIATQIAEVASRWNVEKVVYEYPAIAVNTRELSTVVTDYLQERRIDLTVILDVQQETPLEVVNFSMNLGWVMRKIQSDGVDSIDLITPVRGLEFERDWLNDEYNVGLLKSLV